jgi:hypothetical protein
MQGHTFLLYRSDYVTNTKGKDSVCNKHIIMQGHTFLLYRWDYVTNTLHDDVFVTYTVFTFGIGNIVWTI